MKNLKTDLMKDSNNIINILDECGTWAPDRDNKLNELFNLLSKEHQEQKVLIFTQFSDTAYYLEKELKAKEIDDTGRCIIIGADKCIDNDFRNIDELLLQIKSVLLRRKQHFKIVA
jgi:ERCC4-related helicase